MLFNCPGNNKREGIFYTAIDFTPKAAPRIFRDEEKKGIGFILDNNFWPKR
jgi:hypothetical protein